jgi:tetratricopeptide (TPR) repeat protein
MVPDGLVQAVPPLKKWRHKLVEERLQRLADAGDRVEALEHAHRALDIEPRDLGALIAVGSIYFDDGDYQRAADAFGKALDIDFFNTDALKGHAYSLDLLGRTDDAIYEYMRFLAQKSDDSEVHANFVAALVNSGKTDEAVTSAQRGKELFPKDPMFPMLLAQSYYDNGEIEEAQREIEIACALDRDRPETFRLAGQIYSGANKLEDAMAALDRAIILDPGHAPTFIERGRVRRELGDYESYRDDAIMAKTLFEALHDPEGAHDAYWELGWANYKLGRWREAIQASEKSIELKADAAVPRFNLGLALLRQGDIERSTKEYRAAAALGDTAALTKDGIGDLTAVLQEKPDLPGGASILAELQAYAAEAMVAKPRRRRNKAATTT